MVIDAETADGKPYFNVDRSSPKPLPEKKEVGSGEEKPETPVIENLSAKAKEKPNPRYRRRFRGVY
jgi:hypothetical protein